MSQDRLSNLPDELIHHIFSFMDVRSVVHSSVLSKRWKNLWTSLTVLDFHNFEFSYPILFVDNFLSHRDASSNVYMLKFMCHDELEDGYIADSIIEYVITKGIQVLSISAYCVVQNLPQLSASRTLTYLNLSHIETETTSFDLVSLQQLYLFDCKFEFEVEEDLDPFRGCANLRCLALHDCQYNGSFKTFNIHAPQLIELSISCFRVDEEVDLDCVIRLFTPKLQSFIYEDHEDLYSFKSETILPFIEKVEIEVGSLVVFMELNKTEATNLSLKLIELFQVMGSAKILSLSLGIFQLLSLFPSLLDGRSSPFTKIQNFEFIMDGSPPFNLPSNVIAYLFGGSPSFFAINDKVMVLSRKFNLHINHFGRDGNILIKNNGEPYINKSKKVDPNMYYYFNLVDDVLNVIEYGEEKGMTTLKLERPVHGG